MKYYIFAVLIAIGLAGCVSNTAFELEKQKLITLEKQQQLTEEKLNQLRTEFQNDRGLLVKYGLETEKLKTQYAGIDSLAQKLSSISSVIERIGSDISIAASVSKDLKFLMDRVSSIQDEFIDTNKSMSDLRRSIDESQTISTQMHSRIMDEINRLKNAAPGLATLRSDAVRETPRTQTTQTPQSITPAANIQPIQLATEAPKTANPSEQASYDNAKAAYDKRQFESAIAQFEEYIRYYPGQPLAINAQYWIGESHYALADYVSAFRIFRTVQTQYPNSPKAADALVKMALCNWKMGDFSGAKELLNRVKNMYPGYERLALVNRFLTELP